MPHDQKTVLIAGGAGFIGSHLCEAYLARGFRVVCLDNMQTGAHDNLASFSRDSRFDLIEADIAAPLPKAVLDNQRRFDLVINAACPASPSHYQADPRHTLMTCVVGTDNLLTIAERDRSRFLMCSTSEIYGDPLVHPQVETYWGNVNPTGPRACYNEGKRAAETLCFDYARRGVADIRVARIFNTYGPRMQVDDGRLVSNVICQALAQTDVTVYGDGQQTRSLCYVSDMVEGLMRLGEHAEPVASAVNLGNPVEMTVRALADMVMAMIGTRSAIVQRPLPADDPHRRRPDITLAARLLDWRPKVHLAEGLERTISYFAERITPMPLRAGDELSNNVGP